MGARKPALLLLALVTACLPPPDTGEIQVFLVRHAERADDGEMAFQADPHLSEAGRLRAEALSRLLEEAGLTRIYSTDYLRTRETVAPLAEALGLPVTLYDAADLDALAAELRSTPGRHLVVGHSNTTPELVAALGGDPRGEISHMEYDRLYIVSVRSEGMGTLLLRFGPASGGGG